MALAVQRSNAPVNVYPPLSPSRAAREVRPWDLTSFSSNASI